MTAIAYAQGFYFLITGVWPLLHMDSFLKVTGPKTDLWLVQTVGSILAAIGVGLILGAMERTLPPALVLIAMLSAAGLLVVELIHVRKRTIAPIYLADAAIEAAFLVAWIASLVTESANS